MVQRLLGIALCSLLFFTGCSDAPDASQVQKAIERHIVWQPWQVGSVAINSESSVGDSAVQYQFTVKLSPKEDLYTYLFQLGDNRVVSVGRAQGDSKPVVGVADGKKGPHGWDLSIAFNDDAFGPEGEPKKDGDVVIGSDEYNKAVELANAELAQIAIEIEELTSKLQFSRKEHQGMLAQLSDLRDTNRFRVDKLKQQFEGKRQAIEERFATQSRQRQSQLNEKRKQQLIALNVKFEERFTNAEKTFADRRRALDKAMVDNDRNYNIMVQDVHKAYKADIGALDPNSMSSDEYRSYLDARVQSRDKSLAQVKQEHAQMREKIRVDKEQLITGHRENMELLRQEKRTTLEEARRQQSDEKRAMFGEYQQQLDVSLAELDKAYEARRSELLSEEKELSRSMKEMAQQVHELETLNASKLNRRDALTKGLEAASTAS
ncbi:hypothetical protein ACFSJ3_15295 [Corallincola platygyrae]|uniref:Uncharacterized protein n=1 Tax=Corallincola platygyrae TaxID=1193278 RepID=A0ABW4XPY2_9GAMM